MTSVNVIEELSTPFLSSQSAIEKIEHFRSTQKDFSQKHTGLKFIICCANANSVAAVQKILEEHDKQFFEVANFAETKNLTRKAYGIAVLDVNEAIKCDHFVFIPDFKIIGRKIKDHSTHKIQNKSSLVRSLRQVSNITDNELVVHKIFGVCIFNGLKIVEYETANFGKIVQELIELTFKNNEKLFVPIDNISIITKYSSQVPDNVESHLDSLSARTFTKKKLRIRKNIEELAENIVAVAAKRKLINAATFHKNQTVEAFYDSFPYIPTEDQLGAIDDVENDLKNGSPMERLICGDVGFGKTEVAMRASFLVCSGMISNNYYGQICVIVPTTILAKQHYNSFVERFKDFPQIKIAELSRNTIKSEHSRILDDLSQGRVDILISTHAVFGKNVVFKNLELIILDEEQHFGVKQKEKLKQAANGKDNSGVHMLYLSATPIPRTLNMSISGIRDISIIATPPIDRVATKNFVMPYDDIIIRNAIMREKDRSGRVFFVCPRVSDIEEREEYLKKLLPKIKIAKAHGGLKGNVLDDIMLDFYIGKYDLLLTTSIIESGIDISFANTIIIHKANMFGLSALYQLRGRVGRSGTQAYAYFMVDSKTLQFNKNAALRLKTIANIKTLSAGFMVATSDMDIRGVGNIIGDEQSGNISEVGIELYQEMIAETVNKIKTHTNTKNSEDDVVIVPEVKIGLSVLIPSCYIGDYNTRIEFYKRISLCSDEADLKSIMNEMSDRFGKIPQEILNLVQVIQIKQICLRYFIERLEFGPDGMSFTLHKSCNQQNITHLMKYSTLGDKNLILRPDNQVIYKSKIMPNEFYRFTSTLMKKLFGV